MDYFLQIAVNTLITASIYTLLGQSFSLIYSVNKYFDMTIAAYIILGTYTTYFLQKVGVPCVFAAFMAIIFVSLFAFVVEKFYYQKLRKRKATAFIFMIASLGILTILQALVAMLFTSNVQTLTTESTVHHIFGTFFTNVHIASFALALLVSLGITFALLKTKVGAQLRAISDNEELALTQGVKVDKLRAYTISAAAILASLAGILYGMDSSIEPLMGMGLLFKGVIAAFIVGLSRTLYVPLGAIILATLENAAIWYFSGEWKDFVAFGTLILVLLIRPSGIIKK